MIRQNNPKLDFRIQLLAGSKVAMVEARGYESEIFVPLISNGHITFQNIIPHRRCGGGGGGGGGMMRLNRAEREAAFNAHQRTSTITVGHGPTLSNVTTNQPPATTTNDSINNSVSNSQAWRMSESQNNVQDAPPKHYLSRSSSLPVAQPKTWRESPNVAAANNSPPKDRILQIPSGIKVIRLYRADGANAENVKGSQCRCIPDSPIAMRHGITTNIKAPNGGFRPRDLCSDCRASYNRHCAPSAPPPSEADNVWQKFDAPRFGSTLCGSSTVASKGSGHRSSKKYGRLHRSVSALKTNSTPKIDLNKLQMPRTRQEYEASRAAAYRAMNSNSYRNIAIKFNEQHRKPFGSQLVSLEGSSEQERDLRRAKAELEKMAVLEKRQRKLLRCVKTAIDEQHDTTKFASSYKRGTTQPSQPSSTE